VAFDSDRIWRCTCGATHFLSISSLDGDGYLHLEGVFTANGLLRKLKACYEIFRQGHYDTWIEVLIDKQAATEIRHELANFIGEKNDD
jgi:hypothetical protein